MDKSKKAELKEIIESACDQTWIPALGRRTLVQIITQRIVHYLDTGEVIKTGDGNAKT